MQPRKLGSPIHGIGLTLVARKLTEPFTQGMIDRHNQVAAALALGGDLLEHEPDAAAIDRVLPARRLRKKTREPRFVGAVEDAPRDVGHALSE